MACIRNKHTMILIMCWGHGVTLASSSLRREGQLLVRCWNTLPFMIVFRWPGDLRNLKHASLSPLHLCCSARTNVGVYVHWPSGQRPASLGSSHPVGILLLLLVLLLFLPIVIMDSRGMQVLHHLPWYKSLAPKRPYLWERGSIC